MQEFLKKLGLSSKEVKTYLANLQLGEALAASISKHSGLNRSTTYVTLEKLQGKGFVKEGKKRGVATFTAIGPEELENLLLRRKRRLEFQMEKLEEKKEEFQALRPKFSTAPKIKLYEGSSALLDIYERLEREEGWKALFNPAPVFELFEEQYERIARAASSSKGNVQEIIPDSLISRELKRRYMSDTYVIRLLPQGQEFESDTIILKDKFFLITFVDKRFHIIEIEDKGLVKSQHVMFDALWNTLF